MAKGRTGLLDCRIEVRRYRLVLRPSRWGARGSRTQVLSPVLDLSRRQVRVPVKRYSQVDEDNSVCFLPKEDFEDDGNTCLKYWTDAHGVALRDSSTNDFQYKRGNKFWIFITNDNSGDNENVPVINLQTGEEGTVCMADVCWMPKIEGPNGELWTLGGPVRKMKQAGPRKFTYWSYVICQQLDESVATVKTDQRIPTAESSLADRRLLSADESLLLFEKRYWTMEAKRPRDMTVPLPSPPMTPAQQADENITKRSGYSAEPSEPAAEADNVELWRRIIDMAKCSTATRIGLGETTADTQASPATSPFISHEVREQSTSIVSVVEDDEESLCSSTPLAGTPSPGPEPEQYWDTRLTADDYIGAIILQSLSEGQHQIPRRTEGDFLRSIQSDTSSNILLSREELVSLCDLRDPQCKYITTATCKHYHSSPSKCYLDNEPSNLGTPLPPHEHCISRLRALPDIVGPCILADIPSKRHACCFWREEDRVGWEDIYEQQYVKSKAEKARRTLVQMHVQYHDRSHWVNYKPPWNIEPGR